MKNTPSPRRIIRHGDTNHDHNLAGTSNTPSSRRIIRHGSTNHDQNPAGTPLRRKTQSVFSRFRAALEAVFFWQRKGCSKTDEEKKGSSKTDERPDTSQVSSITSASLDNSTASRNKIPLRFKHSYSSASVNSTSSQASTVTYSLEEISKATGNFSLKNKIGEGSIGTVYKGKLKDGSVVAVKRAKKEICEDRAFAEFKNEILTLSKIEHLNLVRLLGCIEQDDEQIIVVEYVGNGTLREHLDGKSRSELEMAERLDIAADVAHAVAYLHMYTDHPIIHRDIKASNILITDKLRAKVADFGFARLASEDPGATHILTQVRGTAGYVDPEYIRTNKLTEKSDVYSFGVVLVELMTGRQPIESERPLRERVTIRWDNMRLQSALGDITQIQRRTKDHVIFGITLLEFGEVLFLREIDSFMYFVAMQALKEGGAVVAMDPRLQRNPASIEALEKVLRLARHCILPSRQSRPSMKQCGEVLWRIRKEFREKNNLPAASASHNSENINVRKDNRKNMFGIEDVESIEFRSA